MSTKAGTLLWNRQRINLPVGTTDIDTGLRQVGKAFGNMSLGEPGLGDPAVGDASRIQVVPMSPIPLWTDITHAEPSLDATTQTVHVVFNNASLSTVTGLNVLFWDPHSLIGPGAAETYED